MKNLLHPEPHWDDPDHEPFPLEATPPLTADFNTDQAERLAPGCFRVRAVPAD